MESPINKVCASCDLEVQLDAVPRKRDLHGKPVCRYEIVADGSRFGIAFKGEVKIHGMELSRAKTTVSILNEVQEMENEALSQRSA